MDKVVGVIFDNDSKVEYFYTKDDINKDTDVIVEINGVKRFGKVVTNVHPIDKSKLTRELGKVIKVAASKEISKNKDNVSMSKQALKKCKKLVQKYNLNMNVIDAYFTFNQEQLIFIFYADDRVDFRDLAKELASIYKTRIELRQIGVRDKAKKIGGLGLCGQKLCCSRYINDFDSVSIAMAKNQNLSLNPTKINGLCGRLLCCLKYENECYAQARKNLPNVGSKVETEFGEGKVISVDVLQKKYKIETVDKGIIEIDAN